MVLLEAETENIMEIKTRRRKKKTMDVKCRKMPEKRARIKVTKRKRDAQLKKENARTTTMENRSQRRQERKEVKVERTESGVETSKDTERRCITCSQLSRKPSTTDHLKSKREVS